MNQKPFISVIIPTFNRGELLIETLSSVYRQTYKNFEVILIDDNSTDNTLGLLKPFFKRENFIYCRKKIGKNISRSRNLGINLAQGELIALLDSDDLWLPQKLARQVEKFNHNPRAGLVYSDGITFYDKNSAVKKCPHRYILGEAYTGKVFHKLYHQGNFIATSSILVRKEVLMKVGGFDENLAVNEDVDLLLRIALKYMIDCVNEPLIKYRVHKNRISEDKARMKKNLLKAKNKYAMWLK